MVELYRKYRPKVFKGVFGNDSIKKSLLSKIKNNTLSHATMFTGESGCGKTTFARILKDKLGCIGNDYQEINASEDRGIKMIRSIGDVIRAVPMFGKTRVWTIDEAQGLTNAAQNALLKFLEDPPNHAYLILCTTDPAKIIKTIHSRCTQYQVKPLEEGQLIELMKKILKKEKAKVPDNVLRRICDVSDCMPRKALVILDSIYRLKSAQSMMDAVQKAESRQQAIDLARAMIKPKPKWVEVKELVKKIDEEPETVRRIILGYAASVCLNGGPLAKRAAILYDGFRDMFLSGKPDLVFAAFATCAGT